MSIEMVLSYITMNILLTAFILSSINVVLNLKRGIGITKDFNSLLLVLISGWLPSEVLDNIVGAELSYISGTYHLLMMIIISTMLTIRWRWAVKEAMKSKRG